MSKSIYPVILHPEHDGGYSVDIPDLHIGTQGETIAECIEMARDAIGLWGICRLDDGKEIPAPSTITPVCAPDEMVTIVDIDFDVYRRANDLRLTENAGVNFPRVLQDGLKARLYVEDR